MLKNAHNVLALGPIGKVSLFHFLIDVYGFTD